MDVGSARAVAVEWVAREARGLDDVHGAYFSGSTVGVPDDARLPATSDVDVVLVTGDGPPPLVLGKRRHDGVLLEITWLPWPRVASPEEVLSSHHLAGSFRTDTIIADPTGHLRRLHRQVSRDFARPWWVRRRCLSVGRRIDEGLRGIDARAPWHERVTSWLFATGVTTHLPLVAALRNPTVRLRYSAARDVLADHGCLDLHEDLLGLLGCADLSPEPVEHHIAQLARTFDTAAHVSRTPFFFSSDITAAARPVAIDGSRELVRAGRHREAVFWLVATFSRCQAILAADSPGRRLALAPAFADVLADLGIRSHGDILGRARQVRRFLPTLWEATEAVMRCHVEQ